VSVSQEVHVAPRRRGACAQKHLGSLKCSRCAGGSEGKRASSSGGHRQSRTSNDSSLPPRMLADTPKKSDTRPPPVPVQRVSYSTHMNYTQSCKECLPISVMCVSPGRAVKTKSRKLLCVCARGRKDHSFTHSPHMYPSMHARTHNNMTAADGRKTGGERGHKTGEKAS